MSTAYFQFFDRLHDFLLRDQRDQIILNFRGRQSIKHLAESLGVPHPEIGPVQVNGQETTLSTITQDGDRVEVHPLPNGCPIEPRFVLDNHLGRLTAYLRMLGFDCLYRNDYDDEELAETSQREERILLSRDRRLLMRKSVTYGYCLRCNHYLEPVAKEVVIDRLEPLTRLYFDEFQICPACQQIYWKGSHYEKMQKLVEEVIENKGMN